MDHLMHQPSDEVRGHLAGAGNAFGIDRTNNSKAPHASKRAFAGRAQPAGQSSQAPPPFFQASSGNDAQWPSTAVPNHHSNSPVATPQSGAGSPVGSNQMEAFKSMVFQMATFFQQNPEATLPPGFEGLFGQMSVGGASPIQPQQQQQHHMSSQQQQQQQALFGGGANGGYDYQQAFTPPTTTTTAMMMDDAIVDSGNVVVGSGRGGAQLPKPQRRVFAEHPDNGSAPQARLGSANQQHRGQQQDPFPSNPNNSMTYTGTYQQSNRRNNNQQPSSNNNISARSTPNHHNSNMRGGDQQGSQRGGPSRHNNFTASHHQQSNAMDQPTEPKIVVLVEFKRQRMKKYESQMFVSPGQYVVVEGDRGVDCGFVIHCCVREIDGSYSKQESIDNVQVDVARIKAESGRVIRLARDDDVKLLHGEIASSELIALKTCRDLAERMGLSMEIVDCEYQFDRKKISFYFEAPHSVDFRELNTELFRIFGARIWLENLNSKVKNVVPDGALSHADKLQYTKNGLRPPRRT